MSEYLIESRKQRAIIRRGWLRVSIVIVSSFLLCASLSAQSAPPTAPPASLAPSVPFLLAKSPFADFVNTGSRRSVPHDVAAPTTTLPNSTAAVTGSTGLIRRITLEEAQQAAADNNPMARLAQLGVEAAHQHRLEAEADYFPKISALADNLHFNKFMGEEITVTRPIQGGTATAGLPLLGKDQTLVSLSAAQPLTPIFKVQMEVAVARADERLAMAKAGMPVEAADNVEQDYYNLLVAERELDIARANAELISSKRLLASAAPSPGPPDTPESITAEKELVLAQSKVKELTESFNSVLGFPADTELQLVVPATDSEDISLKEATDEATTANPEVVEAQGTLIKARAGQRLAKLDYVPDIAILGGYAYNGEALPLLPRDFSYIGVLGTWTVWDWGKREHTVKERNAQVSEAEMALQLTKAKVAGAVKSNYYEMDRERQLSELAHRLNNAIPAAERASYSKNNPELATTRARIEIEMLRADLAYRKSVAQLKTLMGKK